MSITELQQDAKTWSLASDTKLLDYLQQFSSGITDRTKAFAGKVDDLSFDVAESEVALKNTFNEFLMLGNTQFIENVSLSLILHSIFASEVVLIFWLLALHSAFMTTMTMKMKWKPLIPI